VVLAHIPVQSVHVLRAEVELFFVARPGDVLDVVGGHGLVRRRHVEPGRATDLAGVIGATPALWAIPDSTTPGARRIHRHCIPDMELGHCVTGSMGHLGHLSRPGHRVIILTRRETRTLLSGSVETPNSDKNWQTSCPLQTFVTQLRDTNCTHGDSQLHAGKQQTEQDMTEAVCQQFDNLFTF